MTTPVPAPPRGASMRTGCRGAHGSPGSLPRMPSARVVVPGRQAGRFAGGGAAVRAAAAGAVSFSSLSPTVAQPAGPPRPKSQALPLPVGAQQAGVVHGARCTATASTLAPLRHFAAGSEVLQAPLPFGPSYRPPRASARGRRAGDARPRDRARAPRPGRPAPASCPAGRSPRRSGRPPARRGTSAERATPPPARSAATSNQPRTGSASRPRRRSRAAPTPQPLAVVELRLHPVRVGRVGQEVVARRLRAAPGPSAAGFARLGSSFFRR